MMFCLAPFSSGVAGVPVFVEAPVCAVAPVAALWSTGFEPLSAASSVGGWLVVAVLFGSELFWPGAQPAADVAQSGESGFATVPAPGLVPPGFTAIPDRLWPIGFSGVEFFPTEYPMPKNAPHTITAMKKMARSFPMPRVISVSCAGGCCCSIIWNTVPLSICLLGHLRMCLQDFIQT